MATPVLLAPTPILQFLNNAGQPNAGGTLLTQVGGINYPTYQDSAGNTALPNPIPLNSRGEISNASGVSSQLFLAAGVVYTFTQFDANGNQINQALSMGSSAVQQNDYASGNLGAVRDTIAALRGLSHTAYTRAFITGYYAAGDGGGGSYWYDPSDTTSADNGGTIIVASDGGRWKLQWFGMVSVLQFGVKADAGVTDNTTTLANCAAWVAANAVRNQLYFPAGIYGYVTSPNWAISHARIIAMGEVRLRCSGTLNGVLLDAGGTTQNIYDVTFGAPGNPFIIECESTVTNACFVRACHHSTICIKPRSAGAASAGLSVNFAVSTKFYITCSVNEDGGWYKSLQPTYGIYLTQRNAAEQTSYCTFYTPIIEGPVNGIYLDQADGNLFVGGTSEGCTNIGVTLTANAQRNTFDNMDFEVNTTSDIDDSGVQNTFIKCDTNKLITLKGTYGDIFGGSHVAITVNASAVQARLSNLRYNRNNTGAVITDSGTQTIKDRVQNAATGALDGPSAAFAIPATGSGMTYTNNRAYGVGVAIQGGTVTSVTLTRGGTTTTVYSGTSLNAGIFETSPGDVLTINYSATPTTINGYPRG